MFGVACLFIENIRTKKKYKFDILAELNLNEIGNFEIT